MDNKFRLLPGAKFKAHSFFRPTLMSVAMKDAGLIPDVHLVRDVVGTAYVRRRNDNLNQRPSVLIAF